MRHLLDLVVAHQKQVDAAAPPVDEDATTNALQKYLQKNYGWKPEAQSVADMEERARGIDATIPLADLPNELRIPIETALRNRVRHIEDLDDFRILDAAGWKDARFILANAHPRDAGGDLDPKQSLPFLMLSTSVKVVRSDRYVNQNIIGLPIGFPQFAPQEAIDAANARAPKPVKPRPPGKTQPNQQTKFVILDHRPAPADIPGTHLDLGADAGLQTPVSFTTKRQSLEKFVAALQKQSGVKMQLAPDSFPGAAITASSGGMKLADAMQALERLYVAHWRKDGPTYLLESDHLDEMHLLMAQLGFSAFYREHGVLRSQRDELGNQLADELVGTLDPDLLKTKEGAPFSALPAELQERVLELYRSDASSSFIVGQQRYDDLMKQEVQLRFAPLASPVETFFGRFSTEGGNLSDPIVSGGAGLLAYSKDGRFICQLFPSLTLRKPSAMDLLRMPHIMEANQQPAGLDARGNGQ